MTVQCLISLGANFGDRKHTIREALAKLAGHRLVRVLRASRMHETRAIGGPAGQADFLNAAAVLQTSLPAAELLDLLLQIESELGRLRNERWGPRRIDLDLLPYGDAAITEPGLVVPHPRMAWRRFVLEPAAEIAPEMVHPTSGWTIFQLLDRLNATPYYLAIAGSIGAGKTELARRLTARGAARRVAEEVDVERLTAFYADPASHAWLIELQFLEQRERLLAAGAGAWQDRSVPTVSDFWFDQSAAFARVWLAPEQYARFEARFEAARRKVVRPRLVVLLESTGRQLHDRVLRRGRACERGLTADTLERIARAVDRQTRRPDVGPVLRVESENWEAAVEEVSAALDAMA